jgi:hypothetical protein
VRFVAEPIRAIRVTCEEALVIFPFMFISDATADPEEGGKQKGVIVRGRIGRTNTGDGRARNQGGHVCERDMS